MTLSTHVGTATGSGGKDNDGGVIMHAGNIASGRWTNKSILDIVKGADEYGSKIVVNTDDSSHQVGLTSTKGSGQVGYFPKRSDRTAAAPGFLIRGVSTKINNVSNSVLQVVGSGFGRRAVNFHSEIHRQRGLWSDKIFNLFRNPTAASTDNHGLLAADGAAKSTLLNRGDSTTFRSLSAKNNTAPLENRPSRAVPGELVWLIDFTDRSSSGGNFKDYSAITGG
jgi:hypothetical protein